MRAALVLLAAAGGCEAQKVIEDRCTSIIVGPKAGTEGPMNTHTADCADCDFRVNKVPARDWPEGTMRPCYQYKGNYPATVSKIRGDTWLPENLEGSEAQKRIWGESSIITGYIPEVPHTYALFEAGYGIVNEHQVAIGESTCSSRYWAAPPSAGGKAILEVRELSHIALERTKTAREAIQLMGDLAVKYGFYAADWSGGDTSKGEGGEALTVIDPKEAWMFHITSDDTGTSAVWVAQRVPDNHVAAVANQFVIRKVKKGHKDFMYSDNLWEVAARNGHWDEKDGDLDFLPAYSPKRAHPEYATRRVWRVLDLAAPSLKLPSHTDAYGSDYPFSVPADRALSPRDLMDIQRDHYEGTEFDLTKGLQAGPYGDPNRFDMAAQPADNMTLTDLVHGGFERAISLFRTSYSIVNVARPALPREVGAVTWFSQHAPSASSYIPLYVAATNPPRGYMTGSLFKYDDTVAFWNFLTVGNWAARFYKYAMEDVRGLQRALEGRLVAEAGAAEKKAAALMAKGETEVAALLLSNLTVRAGDETVAAWRELFPRLIAKYHDGYRATNLEGGAIAMNKLFYPKAWLDGVGFWNLKMQTGDDVIMFAPSEPSSGLSAVSAAVVAGGVCLVAGFVLGRRRENRFQYQTIDASPL